MQALLEVTANSTSERFALLEARDKHIKSGA